MNPFRQCKQFEGMDERTCMQLIAAAARIIEGDLKTNQLNGIKQTFVHNQQIFHAF